MTLRQNQAKNWIKNKIKRQKCVLNQHFFAMVLSLIYLASSSSQSISGPPQIFAVAAFNFRRSLPELSGVRTLVFWIFLDRYICLFSFDFYAGKILEVGLFFLYLHLHIRMHTPTKTKTINARNCNGISTKKIEK